MALSQEILHLLDALVERKLDIYFAIDAVEAADVFSGMPDLSERKELRKKEQASRKWRHALADLKLRPLRDPGEEVLAEFVDDEELDAHFTVYALAEIPRIADRWAKLRTVRVDLLPGENVTGYLRQASTCYLYGLFDATAILARTLLQFALEEAFSTAGGLSLSDVDRKDYLKNLIDLAGKTRLVGTFRILSPGLLGKAHNIRELANRSAHQTSCSESAAFVAIRDTAEILTYIYSRTGQSQSRE